MFFISLVVFLHHKLIKAQILNFVVITKLWAHKSSRWNNLGYCKTDFYGGNM